MRSIISAAQTHKVLLRRVLVIALLGTMAVTQLCSIRNESQTVDEAIHIAAGVSYWQKRDFRMNEEHPPLIKLIAALPVLMLHPHVPYTDVSWSDTQQWDFGWRFLYASGNNADTILFAARMPMIALTLLFAFLLYLWGKKIGGDLAGIFTLAFFAFDPNFIAHGRYVTTDVGFALGFTATLYCLVRALERWSFRRALAFGVVFGLTQYTKFSAVFLWPIILFLPFVWHIGLSWTADRWRAGLKSCKRIFLVALAGFIIFLPVVYFGQVAKGRDDMIVQRLLKQRQEIVDSGLDTQLPITQKLVKLTDPETRLGKTIYRIGLDTPIPFWSYWKGLVKIIAHNEVGHLSYLMGKYSETGWKQYFPVAFAVKTPAVTFIAFAVASCFFILRWRRNAIEKQMRPWSLLFIASLFFFAVAVMGNITIGLRHIFPVYPAVFLLIGWFFATVLKEYRNWSVRASVLLAMAFLLFTSISTYPFYTAYATEFIGGIKNGPRYLLDSNNDWGQGLKYLADYVHSENPSPVCITYYGIAHAPYYGLEPQAVPTSEEMRNGASIECLAIISATSLYGYRDTYSWLWQYKPDGMLAGTMYLFDFRNGRIPGSR